jgi:hypothetical protein
MEQLQDSLSFARQYRAVALASGDPSAISASDCLLGVSLFVLGKLDEALTCADRAHRRAAACVQKSFLVVSEIDPSIWARCVVAHVHWMQGRVEQAAGTVHDVLADAEAVAHPVSLVFALTWCGCAVSLGIGDLGTVERSIRGLKLHAESHGMRSMWPRL